MAPNRQHPPNVSQEESSGFKKAAEPPHGFDFGPPAREERRGNLRDGAAGLIESFRRYCQMLEKIFRSRNFEFATADIESVSQSFASDVLGGQGEAGDLQLFQDLLTQTSVLVVDRPLVLKLLSAHETFASIFDRRFKTGGNSSPVDLLKARMSHALRLAFEKGAGLPSATATPKNETKINPSSGGTLIVFAVRINDLHGAIRLFIPEQEVISIVRRFLLFASAETIEELERVQNAKLEYRSIAETLQNFLDKSVESDKPRSPPQLKDYIAPEPTDERLAAIDEFAHNNPGSPVSPKVLEQFPELLRELASSKVVNIPPLPKRAPAKWANRTGRTSPVAFIREVYGQWLGEDSPFTRATLRSLDKDLYQAYAQHISRHPEDGSLVPPLREGVDNWTERALRGELSKSEKPLDIRDVRRLLRTLERRENKGNSK